MFAPSHRGPRLARGLLCALAVSPLLACGSSSSPAADSGPTADSRVVDSAVGSDAAPPLGTLTITVLGLDGAAPKAPLAGATVTVDLPDGKRVEQTTDAAGKAVFTSVDWSKGTATATAYLAGYSLGSYVGLTQAESKQDLLLFKLPAAAATISGQTKNASPGFLVVTPSTRVFSFYERATTDFELKVEAGQPFTLLGFVVDIKKLANPRDFEGEVKGWAMLDHAAVTGPTGVELDFGKPLTPTTFKGTLNLPTQDESLINSATMGVRVSSLETFMGLMQGVHTKCTLTAGKSFAYEGQYVNVPAAKTLVTQYSLRLPTGAQSIVTRKGPPENGATVQGFLGVPVLKTPENPAVASLLHSPLAWEATEKTVPPGLVIYRDGVPVWRILLRPGTTSLVLPRLPAGVKAAEHFGEAPLEAAAYLGADEDPATGIFMRVAGTNLFSLVAVATATGFVVFAESGKNKPMADAEACLYGNSSIPCVKTGADGRFTLPGVPVTTDQLVSVELKGFAKTLVSLGVHQEDASSVVFMHSDAEHKALYDKAGVSPKQGTGELRLSVVGGNLSGLEGATATLVGAKADGPFFLTEENAPDKSLTKAGKAGVLVWTNVPPSVYDLVVVPGKAGLTCKPLQAWGTGVGGAFRAQVEAGRMTELTVMCK
ncbi:MAG: hypothetical protein IT371_15025 [Deltaproteobacteria bacterium]|nr:hypothetical protein [Deltaproteobacteria bacterium]